jgi:hypothetical protein
MRSPDRHTKSRAVVLLLTVMAVSPVAAIALWSIGRTAKDLADPCATWDLPNGAGMRVAPDDPCRAKSGHSESKADAVLRAAICPGVLLAASILAIAGAASSRPRLMWMGAIAMLLETAIAFSIWPLTLIAVPGIIFLAGRVPRAAPLPSTDVGATDAGA